MRVIRIYHSAVVTSWRQRDRELRRRGVDLALIAPKRWNEGGQMVELDARDDSFVSGATTIGRHPFLFVIDPRPLWRAFRTSPDLIDIHEEPASVVVAETLLLRWLSRSSAPYLLYSAQNIDKRYPPPFRWLERRAIRAAAAVYCCSETAAAIVRNRGGRAIVIGLGVEVEQFTVREEVRPAGPTTVIGYVGRLERWKGVDVLLSAIAGLPDIQLTVAGDGPLRRALESQAAELGMAEHVRFIGHVDHGALPALYAGFDMLVVPSVMEPGRLEQFGRVAVEGMAAGIPVIASNLGALPEVLNGAGILVTPSNAQALREAILELQHQPARRASLSTAGRLRAQHWSWSSISEQHLALYEEAIR